MDHRLCGDGGWQLSALTTWTSGRSIGPTVLLLHDRYKDHGELNAASVRLTDFARVVEVRSARTQMSGCGVRGYYWFLGPAERPELTTFGDGLYHLEKLLIDRAQSRPVGLLGIGEGGTMALTLAVIWPELVSGVVSIDGPLPEIIDALPIESRKTPDLHALLIGGQGCLEQTRHNLALRGAHVDLRPAIDAQTAAADWLRRRLATATDVIRSGESST